MKHSFLSILIPVLIVLGLLAFFFGTQHDRGRPSNAPTVAAFYCGDNKQIDATFTTGSVSLTLSDGRAFVLSETMSGSGARYEATSTPGTDIVFWNKGDTAYLTENGLTTFDNCVTGMVKAGGPGLSQFVNSEQTFTFAFPTQFSLHGSSEGYTQSWSEQATTTGMLLVEVDVPQSYASGTNFADAKFTVGTSADPSAVAMCLVNPYPNPSASTAPVTINGVSFTKVTFGDAAAGNRYDTTSYRTVRDNQCYAIEYTIHYGVFENYPAGAVTRFDEAPLAATLDQVAQSFTFLQ